MAFSAVVIADLRMLMFPSRVVAFLAAIVAAFAVVTDSTADLAADFCASVRLVKASIDEVAALLALASTVSPSRPFVAFVNLVAAAVTALLSLVSVVPFIIAFAEVRASSRVAWFVASL